MKSDTRWSKSSWPWELEILAFLCVAAAAAGPYLVVFAVTGGTGDLAPAGETVLLSEHVQRSLQVRQDFLWSAFILLLYLAHVSLAVMTAETITVSSTHMLAPPFFGAIAYFRLSEYNKMFPFTDGFFLGRAGELLPLLAAMLVLTWISTRLRMDRHLRRFAGVHWDVVVPAHRDASCLALILARVQPLFFQPRAYRAGEEGILVEGYTFLMPMPFRSIEYIYPVKRAQLFTPGLYLAGATHDLIAVKLFEKDEAVFISPRHPNAFFRYCEERMEGRRR